jgi:cytochrome c biogenesis protein CcmG, thiol:disulfide interchange protein DsbE
MLRARFLVPLAVLVVFGGLVAVLGVGLTLDPREVPSPLINKPGPAFTLPELKHPDKTISKKDMLGKVWLLNVWASWCVSCREEHSTVLALARSGIVPVIGLDYKDERADGLAYLARMGDPYQVIGYDHDGRVGINFGVYGVPETYVIDKTGVIRYKQIGPVTPEVVRKKILPLVKELNGNA